MEGFQGRGRRREGLKSGTGAGVRVERQGFGGLMTKLTSAYHARYLDDDETEDCEEKERLGACHG